MKKANIKLSWAVAGVAAMALVALAGCTGDKKTYPTQPEARNVLPGIETGPVGANFSCQPDLVDELTVVCQDLSTGEVTAWFWEFGDGRSSKSQNPTHRYRSPGTYLIVLTVSNQNQSSTTSLFVTVGEAPPEPAEPSASFTCQTEGLKILCIDQSSGDVTSWAWDFGDGSKSSSQNVTHTYRTEGGYIVSLKVRGPGGEDSTSQVITVSDQ